MTKQNYASPARQIEVAVLAVGGSPVGPDRTDVSLQEMIFEGTNAVLSEAGITRADLDSVVLSASDLVDGRGIASMSSAAAAGAYMKHETRTTNDGIYALALAALEIWSGRIRTSLVMSWNKMSEVRWEMATPAMFEPFYERPFAMDDTVAQGLAANALLIERPHAERAAQGRAGADRNRTESTSVTGSGSSWQRLSAAACRWCLWDGTDRRGDRPCLRAPICGSGRYFLGRRSASEKP